MDRVQNEGSYRSLLAVCHHFLQWEQRGCFQLTWVLTSQFCSSVLSCRTRLGPLAAPCRFKRKHLWSELKSVWMSLSGTWWRVSQCRWTGLFSFLGHMMRPFDSGTSKANRASAVLPTKVSPTLSSIHHQWHDKTKQKNSWTGFRPSCSALVFVSFFLHHNSLRDKHVRIIGTALLKGTSSLVLRLSWFMLLVLLVWKQQVSSNLSN